MNEPISSHQVLSISDLLLLIDLELGREGGLIHMMSKKDAKVQADIPVAFEMLSLLRFYADTQNNLLKNYPISSTEPLILKVPEAGIYIDNSRILLAISVEAGSIDHLLHWSLGVLKGTLVTQNAGTVCLFFEKFLDQNNEIRIMPFWGVGFFVASNIDRCIPIQAMKCIDDIADLSDFVPILLEHFKDKFLLNVRMCAKEDNNLAEGEYSFNDGQSKAKFNFRSIFSWDRKSKKH